MKLKNKIAAITSAAIVITSLLSGASAEENAQIRKIKGDINRDYIISVADAVALSHCLTGKAFLEVGDEYYADINNDGAVDAFDLMLLRRTILGIREQDIEEEETTEPPVTTSPPITTEVSTTAVSDPVTQTTSFTETTAYVTTTETITTTIEQIDLSDMPEEYKYALDWVWENRITAEKSTERWNTIFDQIDAGNGTLNYVVRWQSYKTVSLEQRIQLEEMIEKSVNEWTDYLIGYDDWKYGHIDVNVVGWAVIDESVILDRQSDEIIYTNCTPYDSQYDTTNGREEIPVWLPNAPDELSRMYHFDTNIGFDYPGGLDKRFDMYLWATQGFPDIGGCGGDWGQRLSDNAYLNMLDGTGIHVFQHELGHGFGITDFYGGEGESDGFPPGGFPEPTIMMAGNSMEITHYDRWQLRYIWSKIKDQSINGNNRFS